MLDQKFMEGVRHVWKEGSLSGNWWTSWFVFTLCGWCSGPCAARVTRMSRCLRSCATSKMEPLSSWTAGIFMLSATLICPRMSWRMGHGRSEPAFPHGNYRMLMSHFGFHFKQQGWGVLQLFNFYLLLSLSFFSCVSDSRVVWKAFMCCLKHAGIECLCQRLNPGKKTLAFYQKGSFCFSPVAGKGNLSLPSVLQLDKTKNRM